MKELELEAKEVFHDEDKCRWLNAIVKWSWMR